MTFLYFSLGSDGTTFARLVDTLRSHFTAVAQYMRQNRSESRILIYCNQEIKKQESTVVTLVSEGKGENNSDENVKFCSERQQ